MSAGQTGTPDIWRNWSGVLAVEDQPNAEGRSLHPGALAWPMLPLPLFRLVENESVYVGAIDRIERTQGRLEASGRITGYGAGDVIFAHLQVDAQGVRPQSGEDIDVRRLYGGNIVGARLSEHPSWDQARITVQH